MIDNDPESTSPWGIVGTWFHKDEFRIELSSIEGYWLVETTLKFAQRGREAIPTCVFPYREEALACLDVLDDYFHEQSEQLQQKCPTPSS